MVIESTDLVSYMGYWSSFSFLMLLIALDKEGDHADEMDIITNESAKRNNGEDFRTHWALSMQGNLFAK